jgi:4-amino-4-deoxy-L-arabinose transferase-like glycosyltransferase
MTREAAPPRADRVVLTISCVGIVLGLLLRLWLPFAIPFGERVQFRLQGLNDEPAHLRYVEYVAHHHALPVQTHRFEEPGAFERADFEFHQPPLYYLLGAALSRLVGPTHALLACRLLSVLCGLGTLILTWLVLRASPLPRTVTLPALMFASLWLTHAYFCALVSNDALSWLLSSWILWLLFRSGPTGPASQPSWYRAAALAVVLGAGLLTKTTMLVFVAILPAVYLWESVRWKRPWLMAECGALLAMAGLIALPWYLRNLAVYGSVWGLEMGVGSEPYAGQLTAGLALVAGTNKYFWFPMQHVRVTAGSRALRGMGMLLLAGQAMAALTYAWGRRAADPREVRLAVALTLVVLAYGARNLRWFAPEARFLLPGFIPLVYAIAAGAWVLSEKARWRPLACLEMLVFALLPFAYLALV